MKCPKCQAENTDTARFCSDCGTQLIPAKEAQPSITQTIETPREDLTTGSTFAGRYQIIEELGKGGMGKVYKVLDNETNERIALKVIKPEIASDKNTIERFRNELTTARKISHRNVCRMYDLNREQNNYFLTMEYVSGGDLKRLIRRTKRLDAGTAIAIAKQICDGLSEAHGLGIIHRDLKPNNVMINDEGNAKIMDFGIARSIEARKITDAGVMIGTAEYMSPEQAEAKDIDHRSDIYSLGVILYEMVTGRLPFEGETALSVIRKHADELPKEPHEYNPQIPVGLSAIIMKCLEKDKEIRYQSSKEICSELEKVEKGIPDTQKVVSVRKPFTSKEITVSFGFKKLYVSALVIFAIMVTGFLIWNPWRKHESIPIHMEKSSIAVLPFEDLSPKKDQEYLCNGLSDELISRLTNIEGLRVPARTSSFSFQGKGYDLQDIGEKLNVSLVLEGSLRKSGNKLRITVQLVNVSDGFPLWSEKYEHDEEDIFVLQDEISLAIVDKLQIQLLGDEQARLTRRPTENLEAYNLYLQGRFFLEKRTEEGLRKAINFYKSAIAKDPGYSLAYIGLADTYQMLCAYGVSRPGDVLPKAKEAIVEALDIDESLADAHTSLGWNKFFFDWEWAEAEREFRRAIALNPDSAQGHQWFGFLLGARERYKECQVEFERALELDPLSLIINSSLIWAFNVSRQIDRATEQFQKTVALDEHYPRAHFWYGQTLLLKGEYDSAAEQFKKALEISGDNPQYLSLLAHAYALADKSDEAAKLLSRLEELSLERYVSPIEMAYIYIGLDEKDKAFEWLERAYKEQEGWMALIKVEPRYDPLRSDPRFQNLLKKMNLD